MYGQFKFLALNKKSDWEQGWGENLQFSDQGLRLATDQKYSLYRTVLQTDMGIVVPIMNLNSGPFGLLFLLDEATNIWTYDFINHQTNLLLAEGHGLFSAGAALAIAKNTLFLLESNPASLIAISITNGQILWTRNEFEGGFPLTMVVTEHHDLLIIAESANENSAAGDTASEIPLMLLAVTADGQVQRRSTPPSFCLPKTNGSLPGKRLEAALGKESQLYILDGLHGQLWVFAADGSLIEEQQLVLTNPVMGLGVDSEGAIYTADSYNRLPHMEDDRYLIRFTGGEQTESSRLAYRGTVDQLWLDRYNRIYVWNQSQQTLSILEQQASTRLDSAGRPQGIFIFPVMDSTTPEMDWHRIILDADIPDDTQIRLSYFSSDHKELLIEGESRNIEWYLQDKSTSISDQLKVIGFLWGKELVNPRDALLQEAHGRYLWLKLELLGSESSSPVLKQVRIYYPRMSLLSYLPAVYQEDEGSRDFLERFLSLFGSFLQGMEEQIDQVYRMFDPEVVTGPFLSWLAGWLALSFDENWREDQVRRLLMAAPFLYEKRGTRAGLEEIIAIYTGEKPLIVEYFQYKYLQEVMDIKEIMSNLYGQDPYGFTVLIKQEKVSTAAQLAALQRIVEEEKPAFTDAKLVILQPWMYMDMHSYLGINTYLSELSLLRLDNKSAMPFSSVIVDMERDNRFATHLRMELDAHLK